MAAPEIELNSIDKIRAGQTTGDLEIYLTDNAGAKALKVYDSDGVEVFAVDSDGNVSASGTLGAELSRIAGSTYSTVQHLQDIFHSSGYVSGGTITDAGGGNIDVAAGTGLIRATDDQLDTLYFFDWAASTGNAIPTDTARYVGVEYNGGSPQVVIKTTDTWDFNTDFPIGVVYNEGGTLHINASPHAVGDHASFMIQRLYETMKFRRAGDDGLLVTETGTRNLVVSSGAVWERLNKIAIGAIDTSVADTYDKYWYGDGVGAWNKTASQTQWDNNEYDDGTDTLSTLGGGKYNVHWYYLEQDGHLIQVVGTLNGTLSEAQDAGPPASVPPRIQAGGFLIAKAIFRKGDATYISIESAFESAFSGSVPTDHGSLAGLGDDDHPHYKIQYSAVYDFAVDGGTAGNIASSLSIPDNAVIQNVFWDVITAPTSAGSTGTIKARLLTDAVDLTATILADGTATGQIQGVPDNSVGNMIKSAATQTMNWVIATEDLTAGKLHLIVEYVVTE